MAKLKYKFLTLCNKNGKNEFIKTNLTIKSFEKQENVKVIKYWQLDNNSTPVKKDNRYLKQ